MLINEMNSDCKDDKNILSWLWWQYHIYHYLLYLPSAHLFYLNHIHVT